MRRIIVIAVGCCIIGFSATAAHSQQSGQRKVGILGRILGLKTVPNARSVMQGDQQQRAATRRQLNAGSQESTVRRQRPLVDFQRTRSEAMQVRPKISQPTFGSVSPAKHEDVSIEAGTIRRVTSNGGRTVSSVTVPTGGELPPSPPTAITKAPRSQSLADVLRNRQSQPLNDVTRRAPGMQNPFVPGTDDVYQPIASGPVPVPETVVVQEGPGQIEPTPQALSVPPAVTAMPTIEAKEPLVADTGAAKPESSPTLPPGPVDPADAVPEIPAIEPALPTIAAATEPTAETSAEPEFVEPKQTTDVLTSVEDEAFVLPKKMSADQVLWRGRAPGRTLHTVVREPETPMHPVRRTEAVAVPQEATPAFATTRTVPVRPASTAQTNSTPAATIRVVPKATQAEPVPKPAALEIRRQPVTVPARTVTQRTQVTPVPAARQPVQAQQLPRITGRANTGGMPVIRPKGHQPPMPTVVPSATAQYEIVQRASQRTQDEPKARVQPVAPRREPGSDEPPGRVKLFPQSAPRQDSLPAEPTAMKPAAPASVAVREVAATKPAAAMGEVIQRTSRVEDAIESDAIRPAIRTRTAPIVGPSTVVDPTDYIDPRTQRMQAITDRPHLTGFKGFCPVQLRDNRKLVDAGLDFYTTFENRTYYFSSEQAKVRFMRNPKRYAPAAGGRDLVLLTHTKTQLEGKLDFAAFYRDQLFLFTSQQALDAFNARPGMYAGRLRVH